MIVVAVVAVGFAVLTIAAMLAVTALRGES
jgi:hypothetical protein